MDDLRVHFRIGNIGFDEFSDLNETHQEKAKQFFQLWEKKVRHFSALHSLNQELQTDSSKIIQVSVETEESLTNTG